MAQPLLSVIVPAYNAAPFLDATLRCLMGQNVAGMEVLAVDDGSTDATPAVLARYPDVTVITQENKGLSAARNAALVLARGEFVVFLDADDLLLPGALHAQLHAVRSKPDVDVAVCRSILFEHTDAGGTPIRSGEWRLFESDLDIHVCHFNIAPPHAFIVRRQAAEGLLFDATLQACEDHDFWFRLLRRGIIPYRNDQACVAYRRHAGSMSSNILRQYRHDGLLHRRIADVLLAHPEFPLNGSYEARLACSAACLCTASRLRYLGDEACAAGLDEVAAFLTRSLSGLRPGREEGLRAYFEQRLARLRNGELL